MSRARWVVLLALFESAATSAAPGRPAAVSPGGATTVLRVDQRCPTFSWGGVEGVNRFDLVVYEVRDGRRDASEESAPVIQVSLPGTAHSWTPSLAQGLEPGGRFVWYVRAHDDWEYGAWSEGLFFQVEAAPSVEEVTAALQLLRRFLAQNAGAQELGVEVEIPASTSFPQQYLSVEDLERASNPNLSLERSLALTVGTSAIHAEVSGTSGVTYGVVGVSNSAAGAGLVADNTAGGPDLVLGGLTKSLMMTESGLDVPSASPQTFNIQNSAGTMTLHVDGNVAFHAGNDGPGSGLDADLLDGSDSSAFAAASHSHAGGDITSGAVAATFVDEAIARDSEIMPTVLAMDGAGSTLDADLLDGADSSAFATASHTHSGLSLQVKRFHGQLGPISGTGEVAYKFYGPTVSVNVTTGQQIIGVAEAPLATAAGVAEGRSGLCYQQDGTGTIANFVDVHFSKIEVDTTRTPVTASAGSPANLNGTYTVGFCFRNEGNVPILENDWVNGWVAVINP